MNNEIINNKKLLISLDNLCKDKDFDECDWVGNLIGAWRTKEIMPRNVAIDFYNYYISSTRNASKYRSALVTLEKENEILMKKVIVLINKGEQNANNIYKI